MSDLVSRLRGNYSIPINDGGGPIDGKMTFDRSFAVPPIQLEAAEEIYRLRSALIKIQDTINDDSISEGIQCNRVYRIVAAALK